MHFNIDFILKYFNKIDFIVNNMHDTAFAHLSLKRNLPNFRISPKLYAMLKFKEKLNTYLYMLSSHREIYTYTCTYTFISIFTCL